VNKALGFITAGILLFVQAGMASADTKSYTVSATIPAATSAGIQAFSAAGAAPAGPTATGVNFNTAVNGSTLSFDPVTYRDNIGIYLPDHYFFIDVGPQAGSANVDVTVSYVEGANPNSPSHGLGWKATIVFVKIVGTTETFMSSHGPKKMLKDLSGEHVTAAELSGGGFLRMYMGFVTKDPAAAIPDPAASEVFSAADRAGAYSGSLVITATST